MEINTDKETEEAVNDSDNSVGISITYS